MRVLVCGSRTLANRSLVWDALDAIHAATPITLLIEGGAHGADQLAARWAIRAGVKKRTFWADWASYGDNAGPRRNTQMMAASPDLVLAFEDGENVADIVRRAEAAGVRVIRVGW